MTTWDVSRIGVCDLRCRLIAASIVLLAIISPAFGQQTDYVVDGKYNTNVWIYKPPSYLSSGPGHPVLLSLHGGSGIVDDNNHHVIIDNSNSNDASHKTPGRLIFENKWNTNLPFIVVSPHLKRDFSISNVNEQNWPTDLLDEVVQYVIDNFNVDVNRIYVTGISVGGAGTWNYAIDYPHRVAAIVPMAGKAAKGDACNLKDIPIWAFHGQDDPLVPNRFSTDMVQAILDCTPPGKYIPHLNLNNSMDHTIWNPLFNAKSGYDIYSWMLKFRKGNDLNKAPSVFTGLDRTIIVRPGPMYLSSEFFDSDGQISSVQWTQVSNLGINLGLSDTDSRFLRIGSPQAGTFTFRLTVTDDDGVSSWDEVQITFVASHLRSLGGMTLHTQNGNSSTLLGPIADDQVWDMNAMGGATRINIQTTAAAGSQSIGRVRWSINSDQHTRDNSAMAGVYTIKAVTGSTGTSGWILEKGSYLVCATPYQNSDFAGEGASLCYKITFSNEVGIEKFYATTGDLSNLTSWNSKQDGTGSAPLNFSANNQWFIIDGVANLNTGPLAISGTNSKLIVSTTGTLNVSNSFTGAFTVEGRGRVNINGGTVTLGTGSLSRTSHVTYNGGNMTVPNATYGHLTLKGAGLKTLTSFIVNGNLTSEPGAIMRGGSADIRVSGNVTIGTASDVPYTLRFVDGYGNQYLNLPGNHSFRGLFIERGSTASVVAPVQSTITIGTTGGGGRMDIQTNCVLKLNGHDLKFINNPALNVTSGGNLRLGQIELTNSTLTIDSPTSADTAFNLYPARGKNDLKFLHVNVPDNRGVKLMGPLNVTEGVKLSKGRILSRGNLTLVSTSTSTAYVAPVIEPATIIGNVNVERMLMGEKDYRYLSFPVENFTVADLQEYFPVTGEFTGSSPGFSKAASIYVYENLPSPGWVPFPSSGQNASTPFEVGKGYAVYVRDYLKPIPDPRKLTFTGPLHVGPLTFPLADNPGASTSRGWNLIGNPYAAPIFWEGNAPITGWTATSVDPSVHVRDNQQDDFKIWDGEAGDDEFNGMIATGQSFWVRSVDSNAALIINEEAKQELTSPLLFRTERSGATVLSIALRRGERKNTCFIKFNSKGQPAWIRGFDSMKRKGDHANISILSADNFEFAIKSLSDTVCSQEARLQVETNGPGIYSILCKGTAFDRLINKLYIVDHFTKIKTEILEGKDFTLEVSTDPASAVPNRFTLIIEKSNIDQPVITLDDGYLVSSVESGLQWMLNGVDIEGATGQVLLPAEDGDYSVRTLGKNCMKTSETFAFRITGAEDEHADVKIYPNPASDYLKVSGLAPGEQGEFEIISVTGASIRHSGFRAGESGELEINLGSTSPGFYVLRLQGRGRSEFKFSVR